MTSGTHASSIAGRSGLSVAAGLLSRHALWVIVGIGATVRFATVGAQDFWLDEQITLNVIRQGPTDLLKSVVSGESNPALYYLLAGGWERVFGSGEAGVRSLSALLGTATIAVVYAAVRAVGSRRAALIAAALTATSPILIWYSQEARNYSLLVFLAALSFLSFLKALDEREGQRWVWGWALASALTLSTHYFAIFLIVPQAAWLLLRRAGPRLDTALACAAIGAVGIALLPLLATQRGRGDWIREFGLSDRLLQIPEHFLVGMQVPWGVLPVLTVVAVAVVALYAAVRAERTERWAVAIAWSLLLVGLALVLLTVLAGEDFVVTRNVLGLWVPFVIGLSVLLASDRIRLLGGAAAAGLCALGLGLAIWTAATPEAQRPAFSDLAEELGEPEVERLIVSQSGFSAPLTRFLKGGRVELGEDLSASELVVIDMQPTESYAVGPCWWLSTCGGVDLLPPPRFEPPNEFELQRTGATRLFGYRVYAAPGPTEIPRPTEFITPRVFAQSPRGS